MYAIIEISGHQEKVEVGSRIVSNRLVTNSGDNLFFEPILVVDDKKVISNPGDLKKFKVEAKILGNTRGPKIDIMRFKNKTRQHTRKGHRQELTNLEIVKIT
ncbi:MAG: 50S ribosomal protein L21 [Bifidobacteriaceae bacterium]|jgi:large subunit ribosomal protein L21|nr:50S ribosomal protein L21 [Bifidobacteriaceae bacterium]